MIVVPAATPVTTPFAFTVAMAGLAELHVTAGAVAPGSASTVAVSA